MRSAFERRVLTESMLQMVRALQRRADCHLAGGAALSGAHLAHRLSGDIDLFCHERAEVRTLVKELPGVAAECGVSIEVVRDAGTFVRASVRSSDQELELDLGYENAPDIAPCETIEGVVVESLADLRAAKVTCLLSRSEPRDLVDLMFLDRAGYPPERDLKLALTKDAGIDPGVLAWLLGQFPVRPLPLMLVPLVEEELDAFRADLRERFRLVAVPAG